MCFQFAIFKMIAYVRPFLSSTSTQIFAHANIRVFGFDLSMYFPTELSMAVVGEAIEPRPRQ
jgi:hypothetical protein